MQNGSARVRRIVTWVMFILGLALVGFALSAELLPGLDITDGFGVVQMAQLLAGLTLLTLTGFLHIHTSRPRNAQSLQADIGVRLGLTGMVFCYVSGFADLLQVGTHLTPRFERPFAGPWQLAGLALGIMLITIGMLLYHTSRGARSSSSLEFLIPNNDNE